MIRRILAAITLLIVSASSLVAAQSQALAAACVTPGVVAHRGGAERYAENTRDSFRDASNIGAGFWETDVRFTSDDVPVIMHDETVDRTTDGTGQVAELTFAQWQQLRTDDDQPVPTLAELMDDQSVDRAYAFVELKTMPTEVQWTAFVAAITSRAAAGTPRPAISSFDPDVLGQVAIRLPGYTRALVQSVGDADPADITPHASILLKHHDAITWSRWAKWSSAGLKVYAWTVDDDPAEWARLSYVAGMITETPRAYLAWKAGRVC